MALVFENETLDITSPNNPSPPPLPLVTTLTAEAAAAAEDTMNTVYGHWERGFASMSGSIGSNRGNTILAGSGVNEDKITAPAGREVVITSRRALAGRVGRGGAGNTISTSSDTQKTTKQILKQERKVLQHYKQHSAPDYKTGRGGAGARGHVNVRGVIPNQERALEKERSVQLRWRAEKEMKGSLRTGRGGSGNIRKVITDGSLVPVSTKGSASGNIVDASFFTTSPDHRRRRFSAQQISSIYSAGLAPPPSNPSSTSQDAGWDKYTMAETIIDDESGIVTTIADPSNILKASSASKLPPDVGPSRVLNEFHEPVHSPTPWEDMPAAIPRERVSKSPVPSTRPNSILQSFKHLNIGKPKDFKRPNLIEVMDITLQNSRQSSDPASSIDYSVGTITTQQPNKLIVHTSPSAALQMISASNRIGLFPPRDIGPTILSLTEGYDSGRSSSERSENSAYMRGRTSSNTSISSEQSVALPSPPMQPSLPSPPILPPFRASSFEPITIPIKLAEPPKRSRPLPIPPVSAHTILLPTNTHPRALPSPPNTSIPVNYAEQQRERIPMYSE